MGQPRFMLAAGASGSGKTLITCGILEALRERGLSVSSFKCGPDYIDPLFHSRVLGARSRNLDTFFTDRQTTRCLFAENARGTDVSVMEGVMGYYDGLGGVSTQASAYDLACATDTPVILIVNTKGMSLSVLPYIKGFLTYRTDSRIRGVILNQMSAMLYPQMKRLIEEELGVAVLGYVPRMPELSLDSRHLGLVLPVEVPGLEEKFRTLAAQLEASLEMDRILALAAEAPGIKEDWPEAVTGAVRRTKGLSPLIAVAKDEAFCFLYEDNLTLLRKMGARIVEFSPLRETSLPAGADGLILCGGYPELFAGKLSANAAMRADIAAGIGSGLPCMAECGGFMYLHREFEDMDGNAHAGVGVIDGRAYKTPRLTRFGYIALKTKREGMIGSGAGEIRAHEFHYFDSTANGEDFAAEKPLRRRGWDCIHGSDRGLWGFPHLYYYAAPDVAAQFVRACADYRKKRGNGR